MIKFEGYLPSLSDIPRIYSSPVIIHIAYNKPIVRMATRPNIQVSIKKWKGSASCTTKTLFYFQSLVLNELDIRV